ncbi:MAG: NADH-quinone oxidoreductase subunit L [Candidatus Omnitrophica bacterium]|nr:NADH-quinone oxidoreductase subunit L [Candidatus Omnitrophota bacterium]MBU1868993.1 NADH-quinone oxidoreductase subunit L [Candidatus Omnitrophota bacterium]
MLGANLILAIIFIPVLGAFFLPLIGRFSSRLRNLISLLLVVISLVLSCKLASIVLSGATITIIKHFPLGLNFTLTADCLAVFMAITSSFIGAVILLYSFGYISHYENQSEYYLLVVLFLGSMMGIIFSQNLIFLYLFWELTAVVSWRLIGFFRKPLDILRADKAFLITVFGALVMLLGFISLYQEVGSFDLTVIREVLQSRPLSNITVLLILFGIFAKSATLPLHTWLPDAGVAPSPVTALLHAAVLVKIGVYVYARIFIASLNIEQIWHIIIPALACLSAIVSGFAALVETDLKRIIAYSTVSQIGFIFFGFSIGNEFGVAGGLLYILMHGLAKAGLFLCAGIVEQNTKIKDVTKLGGLIKTMPFTAIAFLFCSLSVMGVPPFGGFFSKFLLFLSTAKNGQWGLTFAFLAAAVLTVLYLLRAFNLVFLGEEKSEAKEGSPIMVFSVVLLALLSLAGGVLIKYPLDFVISAVKQMLGVA